MRKILPDLAASRSSVDDSELVTEVKAVISQINVKTPDFVQLVIAEIRDSGADIDDHFLKCRSVKSVKDLIAKWRKSDLGIKTLLPTCKLVANGQPVKVKPTKPAKLVPAVGEAKAKRPAVRKPKVSKRSTPKTELQIPASHRTYYAGYISMVLENELPILLTVPITELAMAA